ncbi:MAG: hydrogenase maturation protease [Chloroflexaceae bacterium]|nr:hydrogenase maturation protease [Chloroflexaceae bacterium]NJO06214.1 hydrogenase maturation protease [Chloroflexaceae bacterium]
MKLFIAPLVIGVGNALRGDDSAGLLVAQRLQARLPTLHIETASGEGVTLMELWAGAALVWVIDAVSSGAAVGTIHRLDVGTQRIPARFFHYSTHAFGVAEAIEMARVLGNLPPTMIVYGIEGRAYTMGAALSPEVAQAIDQVVVQIEAEITALNAAALTHGIDPA